MAALALVHTPALHDQIQELQLFAETFESLEDADLSPGVREQLEKDFKSALHGTREKVDRTSAMLGYFEAGELAADREIKRLAERKARLAKQRERLEQYVLSTLAAAGVKKFDGHVSTLAARQNPASVVIDDAMEIPYDFLRWPDEPPTPPPVPDKAAIKAAIARGVEVPGARLSTSSRLVRS
jgi:hypothetical protein